MNELIGFFAIFGFCGYYIILRRGLRELDPSRTVPERVKAAFDTLAEGLLITDARGYILLANAAFNRAIYKTDKPLVGIDIDSLPWGRSTERPPDEPFPWNSAMRNKAPIIGVAMKIENGDGEVKNLVVNATRIEDGRGQLRGVIATFDDVTVLHHTNVSLTSSLAQLKEMQAAIEIKNEQLKRLASCDPLTNCMIRRAFFSNLDEALQLENEGDSIVAFLMLDGDHFKSINDKHGHAVGDRVLIGLVEIIQALSSERELVGRYGGEEFCVALIGRSVAEAEELAERMRLAVAADNGWLPNRERVTVSIGMAVMRDRSLSVSELVRRADEALYAAKAAGRNRVMNWDRMRRVPEALAS